MQLSLTTLLLLPVLGLFSSSFIPLVSASPLYVRTSLTPRPGSLRPRRLVTRDLAVVDLDLDLPDLLDPLDPLQQLQIHDHNRDHDHDHHSQRERRDLVTVNGPLVSTTSSSSSSSPDGSSTSSCGLLGCTESSESASGGTSATSGSTCQFLGGCGTTASSACEQNNDVQNVNTSSSLCGDGKSTNSKSPLSGDISVRYAGKVVLRKLSAAFGQR